MVSTTATQSTTRRAILLNIKKQGEVPAEQLASILGITPSAVRQHLTALLGEGLVAIREQRGGAGRPKHLYSVTAQAEALFPKTYRDLTCELLDYAGAEGPGTVDRLFERRRQRRVADARLRLADKSFDERVVELARILDDDGYLADADHDESGDWRIVEHNCAILEVAFRYGQACSSELGFLRDVMPDAQIDRVSHMASGQRQCAYRIRRQPAEIDGPAPAAS
ncbi:MAG TPA: ArsR family transcriptional regulator [Acidimicrobiales bacterium]|nr:ArsR family transcriptional regulator [Acidimicrobiales bacterium]